MTDSPSKSKTTNRKQKCVRPSYSTTNKKCREAGQHRTRALSQDSADAVQNSKRGPTRLQESVHLNSLHQFVDSANSNKVIYNLQCRYNFHLPCTTLYTHI